MRVDEIEITDVIEGLSTATLGIVDQRSPSNRSSRLLAMRRTHFIAAAVPIFVVGCGGGGGGGNATPTPPAPTVVGSKFAPSSGPGDTMSYFPLAAGDRWFYDTSSTGGTSTAASGINTVFTNGTKSVQNQTATVVTANGPTVNKAGTLDSYYFASPGGITYLGNSDTSDPLTPQIVPFPQLLFPAQTGTVASISGSHLPLGKNSQGNSLIGSLTYTITNADIEAITVPAGSFPNALKQVTATSVTGTDSTTNQSTTVTGTDTIWLVPGIGTVKEISVVNSNPPVTTENDLRGYIVNGHGHGLSAPETVATGVGLPSDPNVNSIAPVVATDGTNFLVGVPKFSGASPNTVMKWVGYIVQPDGTTLRTFDLTAVGAPVAATGARAAVGFDGTNYLFVYIQDNDYAVTMQYPSIAAESISPAGTVLAGPNTVATGGAFEPSLAFNGANFLLVYQGFVNPFTQIYAELISPSTATMTGPGPVPVETATGGFERPCVAFDGTNFMAVWEEFDASPSNYGVFSARIDAAGTILDSPSIAVALVPTNLVNGTAMSPAISFDGSNYVIAYQDHRIQGSYGYANISAARVSRSGVLLDGTPATPGIAVTTATGIYNGPVPLTSVGGQTWVTWITGVTAALPNPQPMQINGASIASSGAVTSSGTNGIPLFVPQYGTDSFFLVSSTSPSMGVLSWLALPPAFPLSNHDATTSSLGTMAIYPP
jgi:hypothetical protein